MFIISILICIKYLPIFLKYRQFHFGSNLCHSHNFAPALNIPSLKYDNLKQISQKTLKRRVLLASKLVSTSFMHFRWSRTFVNRVSGGLEGNGNDLFTFHSFQKRKGIRKLIFIGHNGIDSFSKNFNYATHGSLKFLRIVIVRLWLWNTAEKWPILYRRSRFMKSILY